MGRGRGDRPKTGSTSRALGVVALAASLSPRVAAAADYLIGNTASDKPGQMKDGFDWALATGATFNLSDNRRVVGQTDGATATFGYKLDANADWRARPHEWRTTTAVAAGLARTPQVPQLVKAQDGLALQSIYLLHFHRWIGAFARASWDTTMFGGADNRPEPALYSIARLDGSVDTVLATRLVLTDPWLPQRLKQSLGLFSQPWIGDPVSVEVRLGAGGRETIARGQLALDDDGDTPQIEVKELDDLAQLGVESVAEVWGSFDQKRLKYRLSAEAMVPLWHSSLSAGDERGAFELTNILIEANLSVKVVDWASLDYRFKALREPQLLDAFQIQNYLLVTFGVTLGTGKKKPDAAAGG